MTKPNMLISMGLQHELKERSHPTLRVCVVLRSNAAGRDSFIGVIQF